MLRTMMMAGLACGLLVALCFGPGQRLLAVQADAAGDAADDAGGDKPKREVDLKVISDPSHEKMNLKAPKTYEVLFETTAGEFTIVVTRAWAPIGADRFYSLVKNGYYDGNRFFRVVPGFVAQFGLHGEASVNQAWKDPKNADAANLKDDPVVKSNTEGMITFANAGPDTRSTQLFINFGENKNLDRMGFAPFGEVKGEGMKVVKKIYSGYGEGPPTLQRAIIKHGDMVLEKVFPKMDKIISATVVVEGEPADEDEGEAKESKEAEDAVEPETSE